MKYTNIIIGGLPTLNITREMLAQKFLEDQKETKNTGLAKTVFSSNGQGVALSTTDLEYKKLMLNADYIHADGMSVVFASKLKGAAQLPERIATTDFVHDISKLSTMEKPLRYFLFGGHEDVVQEAKQTINKLYPSIEIVGLQNGYDFSIDLLVDNINCCKPDIVWVALGKPLQEKVSCELQQRLIGVTWIKTCGGLFDFLSGRSRRAPEWMQEIGLEWFHRLLMKPKKFFFRYLVTNLIAIYAFVKY